jgi:hypothetical protein
MATGVITLLDIAKFNGHDRAVGLIDETTKATPEVREIPWRPISGINYKVSVWTSLPTQAFRAANVGTPTSKATMGERLVETFISESIWNADMAVADRAEYGAMDYMEEQAALVLEGKIQAMGRQFFYGRTSWNSSGNLYTGNPNNWIAASYPYGGNPNGPPGLLDLYQANSYAYSAGGSTALTATSVWGVKIGDKNVHWVAGKNGYFNMTDVRIQQLNDANNNPYNAYIQSLMLYPGLQIGDIRSVVRIDNLTTSTDGSSSTSNNSATLNDDILFQAMSILPANIRPDMWFMNRRSITQLRQSRTSFNPAGTPALLPDSDTVGIPIKMTDSLANNEPIGLASAGI